MPESIVESTVITPTKAPLYGVLLLSALALSSCDSEGERRAEIQNEIKQIDSRLGSLRNQEQSHKRQVKEAIAQSTLGGFAIGWGVPAEDPRITQAGVGAAVEGVKNAYQAGKRIEAVRSEQQTLEAQRAMLSGQLRK